MLRDTSLVGLGASKPREPARENRGRASMKRASHSALPTEVSVDLRSAPAGSLWECWPCVNTLVTIKKQSQTLPSTKVGRPTLRGHRTRRHKEPNSWDKRGMQGPGATHTPEKGKLRALEHRCPAWLPGLSHLSLHYPFSFQFEKPKAIIGSLWIQALSVSHLRRSGHTILNASTKVATTSEWKGVGCRRGGAPQKIHHCDHTWTLRAPLVPPLSKYLFIYLNIKSWQVNGLGVTGLQEPETCLWHNTSGARHKLVTSSINNNI